MMPRHSERLIASARASALASPAARAAVRARSAQASAWSGRPASRAARAIPSRSSSTFAGTLNETTRAQQWPPKSGHGSAKLSYGGWVRERFNG